MIISEPDIQWWLKQRGYDYAYINITDQAAMINELQKLGNDQAVLIPTLDKGTENRVTTVIRAQAALQTRSKGSKKAGNRM